MPTDLQDAFYSDLDEVLGPPPARLYRYGSGVLLLGLVILAVTGACLRYREGIAGVAFVMGSAGHYRVKIALDPGAYPSPAGRSQLLTGRQVVIATNGARSRPGSVLAATIRCEPYLDSASRTWVVDAALAGTGVPPAGGEQAGVFIETGKRSLLSRLFRF
jgi:hypothetical protein